MDVFEPRSQQSFSHEVDDDDIPFDIDPWMHDGVDGDNQQEIDQRGIEDEEPSLDDEFQPNSKSTETGFPRLMTGSELAKQQEATIRIHPSMYQECMTVSHDEYGEGTIETISGKNLKQTATVHFPGMGKKRFRLAFSNLSIVEDD